MGEVEIKQGSVLNSDSQTLVNTVNCRGVMGKGLALEFKKRFPAMYREYVEKCERGEVRLGEPYLYPSGNEQLSFLDPPATPWILNFPTKGHWRARSRIADIESGLDYLESHYLKWGIQSLAVPPLGCGNGGLDWGKVRPLLEITFERFDIPVELWVAAGTPGYSAATAD